MQNYFKGILCILMCLSIMACSSPNSPKGVAKSFWNAVVAQDQDAVRKYSSSTTQGAVDFSKSKINWKEMKVTLGTTEMAGDQAMVHTVITNDTTGGKYVFNTYLVQEDGSWRVDFVRTREASITSEIFADIIKGLQEFNKGLNDNFEATVAGFREAAPEIKVQLDQLTDNLAKNMQGASKQGDQHMHQNLEDFKSAVMGIFAHHPSQIAPAPAAAPAQQTTPDVNHK